MLHIAPSIYPFFIKNLPQVFTALTTFFYSNKVIGFGDTFGFEKYTITLFINHKNMTNFTFSTYEYVDVFSARY